ncbi:S8/S53 family peptidase [Rhizobium leguminosarum]|uniref:S8/S53 family peptidase n=1 Tax=Rhizobium TaxID=379 RepID=UPI0018D58DE7|nr:S8/S53 family peptidase [Rhizobium leguminosarum]
MRESSRSAFSMTATPQPILDLTDRGGLYIDPSFPPLPLATRQSEGIQLEMATPGEAPAFVARGTIDADRIGEVREESQGVEIFADPEIGLLAPYCGSAALGAVADVAKNLDVAALAKKGLDGSKVAVAIMDTGMNVAYLRKRGLVAKLDRKISWTPPGVPLTPGAYAVDHGTMCAFNILTVAPAAALLDFPILKSRTPGGSAMAGFLSDALLAFAYLNAQLPTPAWKRKYKALVVNNSWGMYHPSWDFPVGHPGRYANNPRHPFNIIVGTLARAGADILFAAGNCGSNCPDGRCAGVTTSTITGANAHADVLTIAGCDVNDSRVGYSSQGPGIPGMVHDKPDLTAYTHFVGSEVFGVGSADSGTSTASPVAAGCVAAIRTRLPPGKSSPSTLFSKFRDLAEPKPGPAPGWNADYGTGIIRPLPVANHYGL